jgi:hypothetical protein
MAGFRWHPEIWPIAKAIVRTVRPNARATPRNPIPRPGNAAARTALPHPPKTNQNVPKNSAAARFPSVIELLPALTACYEILGADYRARLDARGTLYVFSGNDAKDSLAVAISVKVDRGGH